MILVFSTFGREKKPFSRLLGMSSVGVSYILSFLVAEVGAEMFRLKGSVVEPEVFLGEDKAPRKR